ncbi:MAG: LamG domain-containing protein [Polyangiaceae bacterium]|nr:LamG domain-containing protein [Polyangiaceae bacterium]
MRRWYRVGAQGATLLVGVGLGIMAAACSSESEKAPGVLMLALSTNMQVPKDFDQVLVQVQSGDSKKPRCKLLAWSASYREPATQNASECAGQVDTKQLKLPATVGLASQKTGEATVTVTAYRGSETVFCQSFKATGLPTAGDGRVPMKRVDISWLETKEAGEDVSCSKATEVAVSDLPEYSDEVVFGGAEGQCFDTLGAVQSAKALEVDLSKQCAVADVASGSSVLLVKPAGGMGICGRAACFVPLDARVVHGGVELPAKACDSGGIRAVLAIPKGDAKTESIPTCGAWSSVTSKPGTVEDPLPLARELLAYWNIDEGAGSKKWVDVTYQGHDLDLGDGKKGAIPHYVDTRVGGRGTAARFGGAEYAQLRDAAPLESQTFTLSAWVSFGPDDIEDCTDATWPLISTRSGECDGYELGIRCTPQGDGGKTPSAVFAYGCDDQQNGQELVAALPKNSGKWTAGDWYHLAATYDGGRATLFLDGSKATSNADESSKAAKLAFDAGGALYVGKNPAGTTEDGFHGYLDEVLVYGRALDDETMRELYETSVTVQGPSGMRWGTWDAIGSVASLGEDSEEQDLSVQVDEKVECSSGGAVAHLSETQREQLVYGADTAVLDADINDGEWFEFSMSGLHGRPQCTWYGVGGGRKDYKFDLKRPNWCANSDGCAIDPSSMRTATISTHWKNQVSLTLSIKSLEFWPSSGGWFWNGVNGRSPDGVNLCWRPVTYEPEPVASALWSNGAWDDPEWPVTLGGEKQSTAEAAAFVLGHPLNLTGCTGIEITWGEGSSSGALELTIENADGVTCSEPVTGKSPNPQKVSIPSSGCYDCAGSRPDSTEVTPAVTRIAIRKQWDNPFGPAGLNVEDIALLPRGCAGTPE